MMLETRFEDYEPDLIAAGLLPNRTTGCEPAQRIPVPGAAGESAPQVRTIAAAWTSSSAATNTERMALDGISGWRTGVAIAVFSTCIAAGSEPPDPARQWHVSTTDLHSSEVSGQQARVTPDPETRRNQVHQRMLTSSIGRQTREALAALGISKSQMAEILGIQRPHLYAWLADKVDRPEKAGRLYELLKLLDAAGIDSRHPIRPHLITEPLQPGDTALLALLKARELDFTAISSALEMANRLNRAIDEEARQKQARMRAAGHDPGSEEEQKATLEDTLTLMEWDHL